MRQELTVRHCRLTCAAVGVLSSYGFQDRVVPQALWLLFCFAIMILSAVFPFMDWFNREQYRVSHTIQDACQFPADSPY